MPNPFLIRNFLGAPNIKSITSTQSYGLHEDKSPEIITLTDMNGKHYSVQEIEIPDFDDNVVRKIELKFDETQFGGFYQIFSHDSQKLMVNKEEQYFTLSWYDTVQHTQDVENTDGFKLCTITKKFPTEEYNKFIKWKKDHVDNVPELKKIILIS